MDPACFLYFGDNKSKERQLKGIIGCHVDDTIALGEKVLFDKVVDEMKDRFTYGSHNKLPFKFTGLAMKNCSEGIIIDQDKYVNELQEPDLKTISKLTKDTILDQELQSSFRYLSSKLNMLSITLC